MDEKEKETGKETGNEQTPVEETDSAVAAGAARSACCCNRKTVRTQEERRKLINRLKRIEGQIRGIIGMLENDTYCNDILIQSAAVNAAINAFNRELLESHLRSCVVRDIREGHDETVDELVSILKKLMK